MCKQISSQLEMKLPTSYLQINMNIWLNTSKYMTDVKLLLLHGNVQNHLMVCKQIIVNRIIRVR